MLRPIALVLLLAGLAACVPGKKEDALPPVGEDLIETLRASCEKSGGRFGTAPAGTLACFRTTRDAGQACTRATECESACLARSRSCAPITPLFGCNEILNSDGAALTECLQ